jgi:hypothetical protein
LLLLSKPTRFLDSARNDTTTQLITNFKARWSSFYFLGLTSI